MSDSKNFIVNRSSAGSGKTYTLSLNFIALALVGATKFSVFYYRSILAITFTNKAAAEMKERVLEYLEVLSEGKNEDGVLDWLKKNTPLSESQIIKNAGDVKSSIIHNYADLRISTIDKFTYNIVRTFSSDLGLSHNFELEMDNNKIIQPVVAALLSKMSEKGGALSEALVNFALQKAEDGKSTNIETDLEDFSRNLFNEDAIPFISSNNISVLDCMKVKDHLLQQKKKISSDIQSHSDVISQFFIAFGFTKDHFIRGSFFNHFTKNLSDEKKWTPSSSIVKNIAEDVWYSKTKADDIKDLIDLHKLKLVSFYEDLMKLISEYNTVNALFTNIYSIAVLNKLMEEVNLYKKEQNIEQISVFNKKINDVIVKQPSNFIYERIGERYNHFLIDEFQDTSVLQWQNLMPLITDVVDYGSCFIVGDGKQSIYRWRGGEVEQFLKIPEIFKGDNLPEKTVWEQKLSYHYKEDKGANQNYRSRKNIIDFNNKFFSSLKNKLTTDLQQIYTDAAQNTDVAKDGGYVHLELVKEEGDGFKENIIAKMIAEINKLTNENGFEYKDITILCNSRKRVSLVAERFSQNGINVVSNEGLLINSSEKVRLIISVMSFLLDGNDDLSKVSIVNYLQNTTPISEDIHSLYLKIKSSTDFSVILKKYKISINKNKLLRLPLYEVVEKLNKIFNIKEDVYTSFFLDVVLSFSDKNGSNLSHFMEWWEDKKDKESIVIPEGTNAVQVMTIHKSKGLAFNVVMIPFNWEGGRKYSEIWVDSSCQTNSMLNSSLIRTSKKLEQSDFEKDYRNENELSFMDSLNKLYVAMTRPVERLYVYAKEYPKTISDSFLNSGKLNSFFHLYGLSDIYIDGDADENPHLKEKDKLAVYNCDTQDKIDWEKVVSLKRSSEKSWEMDDNDSKKDWGKLLHLALSKITSEKEISQVCKKIYLEGLCSKEKMEDVEIKVRELFSHPELKVFFDNKWRVKNEREILTPSGESYIPDRILFSEDKTWVVDYKTGAPDDSHKNQIINYANVLQQMGYNNIEKYLIYTNDDKLVHKI